IVYALGNPGGLELQSSFTDGIVSGLNRVITTDDSIYSMTVLQTSAAINPGNSGGALINEYGQVIGITSSKIVSTGYEGIGFAIPTELAKPIIEEIINNGYVSGRAKLGITGTTIDSVTAKYYDVPEGVQIITIEQDGCLYGTEAKVGDIIIGYNGEDVTRMEDLQGFLAESNPGDEVELTLYRYSATRMNDLTFTVKVKLAENKG
ncbi:MAG: trypsin-like peptidase domain-containing protein, partial [Oscillospiraceae bacterium]|nr:trypsin-like peptidase domain-containing protein [Oscillospiraceae bacterium]